jgi:hypothetical protein
MSWQLLSERRLKTIAVAALRAKITNSLQESSVCSRVMQGIVELIESY